ncbi:MAG: paraquat-inducible protein A [Rhodobacteraceae bacterium]|uniref:paraquat-inducible protein A n=1 Tax=Celeribacter sp. HF31 TaxID=2721558 RepID=UPI001430AB6C|nr:paraquat-inducible protein A [Celeribacter sp. HF31]NIY80795.1 paraquat-inducible membrane protein A [Celeribacter sp. HF31]NVK45014.1 paraquat-inducible protein A [Paracoccaceae bacterium]
MENTGRPPHILTARDAGLVGCTHCGKVHPPSAAVCGRCGAALHARDIANLQKVWAWLIAGMVVYIPANLYPMLSTASLGHTTENTILGGVIELMHHGSYGVAAIVFVASIIIPVAKFIAIAFLGLTTTRRVRMSAHHRHVLFEVVEFIGRWSMIDVFVVAILSSLVRLDFAATITPGIAAISFALSVAFTMMAALSFDERLIWDALEDE